METPDERFRRVCRELEKGKRIMMNFVKIPLESIFKFCKRGKQDEKDNSGGNDDPGNGGDQLSR